MSQDTSARAPNSATLSQHIPIYLDEAYELNNPFPSLPQRQQHSLTPQSQRPPSSSSASARSLRRTPRFPERGGTLSQTTVRNNTPGLGPQTFSLRRSVRSHSDQKPSAGIVFDQSGSTTPQSFQRLVEDDSLWPQRTTHISRRTHDAILFALEAVRAGKGSETKPLTVDIDEEGARMSDLLSGLPPIGSGTNDSQNGSTGFASGTARANAPARTSVRTPTQIVAERARRDAERRRREEETLRLPQENVVGVVGEQPRDRRPLTQNPVLPQSQHAPEQRFGGTARRPENVPPQSSPSRVPFNSQATEGGGFSTSQYNAQSGAAAERRPVANPAPEAVPDPAAQQEPQSTSQQAPRSSFPHAFERWETLSSHWEGLTSYWIRRLQENTNELSTKPIDQQMSRQITDLSAAGANLFHAVVELQRLRASSERKFQRWFYETRREQEQARNREAELERQLQIARDEQGQTSVANVERARAEDLVREMRREHMISKEEARRAWEELGRREQEERERTNALRSGETTVIGGVQVVPIQGIPSRQTTGANRPTTSTGPVRAEQQGPIGLAQGQPVSQSQTTNTSLDSPEREQQQFTYQGEGASPADTDPFTETSRRIRHEPDTQFYPSPQRPTQPPTSSAAIAAARGAAGAPSMSEYYPSATNGDTRGFYQQPGTDTAIYSPVASGAATQQPIRTGTAGTDPSDGRSYIPSTTSGSINDLYETNPDGSYTLDAQDRPIPTNIGQARGQPPLLEEDEDDDEYDVASEVERDRLRRQQYGALPPQQPRVPPIPTSLSSQQQPSIYQTQRSSIPPVPTSLPPTASPPIGEDPTSPVSPDYSGAGYGASPTDLVPRPGRRYEQTRLSDILEERSGRTSPSRASYVSAGQGPGGPGSGPGGMGGMVGGYPTSTSGA